MTRCPLYNDESLVFTGKENPYALIQHTFKHKGGKKKRGISHKKSNKKSNKKIISKRKLNRKNKTHKNKN